MKAPDTSPTPGGTLETLCADPCATCNSPDAGEGAGEAFREPRTFSCSDGTHHGPVPTPKGQAGSVLEPPGGPRADVSGNDITWVK